MKKYDHVLRVEGGCNELRLEANLDLSSDKEAVTDLHFYTNGRDRIICTPDHDDAGVTIRITGAMELNDFIAVVTALNHFTTSVTILDKELRLPGGPRVPFHFRRVLDEDDLMPDL